MNPKMLWLAYIINEVFLPFTHLHILTYKFCDIIHTGERRIVVQCNTKSPRSSSPWAFLMLYVST